MTGCDAEEAILKGIFKLEVGNPCQAVHSTKHFQIPPPKVGKWREKKNENEPKNAKDQRWHF
jgi:hypothetical protein